jgi:SulP family sulfate permease
LPFDQKIRRCEPSKWRGYIQTRASDRVLLFLTLALTVLADLTIAIGVSLGLALRLQQQNAETEKNWTPLDR